MLITAIALGCLAMAPCSEEEESVAQWPQFLGPGGIAIVAPGHAAPLTLDRDRDLLWSAKLPGGSSSPCISGHRIFLTAHEGSQRHMVALDRRSGAELWRRTIESPGVGPKAHVDADTAAPTPCTDGERVVFYLPAHGVVVTDLDGDPLWQHALPVPEAPFGIGTSPIIVDDMVILSRDGCPDSSIIAFDKHDGSERWRVPRIGFTFSFGTPFVWDNAVRRELVVAGTCRIVGLDLKDGRELWQVNGQADFICTTPTADENTLYFAAWSTGGASPAERARASWGDFEFTEEELADGMKAFARLDANGDGEIRVEEMPPSRARDAFVYLDGSGDGRLLPEEFIPIMTMPQGRGRNVMVAVEAGGSGDITGTHVRWSQRRGLPYVASPLLFEGRLYLVKSGGFVTCLDPATGEPHFDRTRLDDRSEYYASPVGVDGHVLICSSAGSVFVLRAGDEFDVIRRVDFDEPITATPAVVEGRLYLRSASTLWAFGPSEG